MKKIISFLFAALCVFSACSETDTPAGSDIDYSEVLIQYEAQSNLTDYMTVTVAIDGKTVLTINKASDSYQYKITKLPATGTISCKAVVNENYAWGSEKLDYSLNLTGHVATISKSGGYSSIHSLDLQGAVTAKGIKAEKAKEYFQSKADLLTQTFSYSIDANGSVTVK